jgi:hypothetical protein
MLNGWLPEIQEGDGIGEGVMHIHRGKVLVYALPEREDICNQSRKGCGGGHDE